MAVFDQDMTHKRELRFLPFPLAPELRLGIGRRLVRIVGPRLSVEVYRRIAGVTRLRLRGCSFLLEALVSRPGLDQRSVHGKMLVTEELVGTRQFNHFAQERLGDIPFQQSVPVLAEGRVVPHLIIHRQPYEPPKQEIVVQLLDQQPFTTNRIQYLHEGAPARDTLAVSMDRPLGIQLAEHGRELLQNGSTSSRSLHAADDPPVSGLPATRN